MPDAGGDDLKHIVVFAGKRMALHDLGHALHRLFEGPQPVALVVRDLDEAQDEDLEPHRLGVDDEAPGADRAFLLQPLQPPPAGRMAEARGLAQVSHGDLGPGLDGPQDAAVRVVQFHQAALRGLQDRDAGEDLATKRAKRHLKGYAVPCRTARRSGIETLFPPCRAMIANSGNARSWGGDAGMVLTLDDKYTAERGAVYLTGTQALVRLPMAQIRRDRAAGLDTGAFISGYRGSPLGAYDQQLVKAKKFLD